MLKKLTSVGLIALLLTLSACNAPWAGNDKQKVVKNAPKGSDKTVTLIPQTSSKDYRSIHPKKPSETRGYIQYGVSNRVDIDQIELGLMRLSKQPFSPDNYAFQEGQYLQPSDINTMLKRKNEDKQGLNPALGSGKDVRAKAENSPKILSYVLEQDYLKPSGKDSYKIGGVSIAVSLNQVYSDQVADKAGKLYDVNVPLDMNMVKAKGKAYAKEILKRVRAKKGLSNVPVFIALYTEAPPESLVPGSYFASTLVSGSSSSIGNWNSVKEDHVMFPSNSASKDHKSDADSFDKFKTDVQDYFSNYIGVVGKATYRDGELKQLNFDINIKFYDKTEVESFTNYIASLLSDKFPFSRDIPVSITISSVNKQEALIVKNPGMDKPFVYVYNSGA